MYNLISKFKQNMKYNSGIGWVINKGSKVKACCDCGANINNKGSERVLFTCDCNHERKSFEYVGERSCGVNAECPACSSPITLCC